MPQLAPSSPTRRRNPSNGTDDFFDRCKLVYTTAIDLSKPEGPSVNEREFAWALHRRFGERLRMLLARPERAIPELAAYRVRFIRHLGRFPHPLALLGQVTLFRQLRRATEIQGCEFVVARLDLLPFGFYLFSRRTRTPYALKHLSGYPRNFVRNQTGFKRLAGHLAAPVAETLHGRIARHALAADCCTPEHLDGAVSHLGIPRSHIQHVANGTNTDRFAPRERLVAKKALGVERFSHIVGYVGGRPWERGGTVMAMAAPDLLERFPALGFVVIGGGQGMERLKDTVARKGLRSRFVFPGVVPYDRISAYVNSFDVGIAFDRSDAVATVGNSNQKVRQYIAAGVPAVTSRAGGAFVAANGLGSVVDPDDMRAVVQAIARWLSLTPRARQRHRRDASAYARIHLSNDALLDRRIRFWRRRLASGSAPSAPSAVD